MGLLVTGTLGGQNYQEKAFTPKELYAIYKSAKFDLEEIIKGLPEQIIFEVGARFRGKDGQVAYKVDMVTQADVQGGEHNDLFTLKYFDRKIHKVSSAGFPIVEYSPRLIGIIEGKLMLTKKKDLEKIIFLILSNQNKETPFFKDKPATYVINNPYAKAKQRMEIARLKRQLDEKILTGSVLMLRRKSRAFNLGNLDNTTDDYVRSKYFEKLNTIEAKFNHDLILLEKAVKGFQEKFESSTSYMAGLIQDCLDKAIFEQVSDNRNIKTIKWGRAAHAADRGNEICKVKAGHSVMASLIEYTENHLDIIQPKLKSLLHKSRTNHKIEEAMAFADELYNEGSPVASVASEAKEVKSIDVQTLVNTCIAQDYISYDRKEKAVYKIKGDAVEKNPICKVDGEELWTIQFAKYLTDNENVANSLRAGLRTKLAMSNK